MATRTPSVDPLATLDQVVAALPPRSLTLGSTRPFVPLPRDPAPAIDEHARLLIGLAGEHRYVCSRGGERVEATLAPGDALYLAPRAWAAPARRAPCRFLGLVFRQRFLRLIVGEYAAGSSTPTVVALHTRRPLAGPGALLARALDALAEAPRQDAAGREIFAALLRLALVHLREDGEDRRPEAPGAALWRATLDQLHRRYAEPIGRESVARALRVHPNHLSAVCREHGGTSFREALQAIRAEHARHLARATDLPLAEIAARCGYAGAGHLAKAFRRAFGITPGAARRGS